MAVHESVPPIVGGKHNRPFNEGDDMMHGTGGSGTGRSARVGVLATFAAALMMSMAPPAAATTLTFELFYTTLSPPCVPCFDDVGDTVLPVLPAGYGYPEGYAVAQDYGDNVTGTGTGVAGVDPVLYRYGQGAEGTTPNVSVSYGPYSIYTGGPQLWREGYGDLNGVLWQQSGLPPSPIGYDYDVLDIVLTADPGFDVKLYDFNLAAWTLAGDQTIGSVSVFAGVPFPFLTPSNFLTPPTANVLVSGTTNLFFNFGGTPLQAPTIWLRIDASNLGSDSINIAIDNIRFGQVANASSPGGITEDEIDDAFQSSEVPEPATMTLMLLGGAGMVADRARRRRRAS
jgi:hypothetical protein